MRAAGVIVALVVLVAGCNSFTPVPQDTPTSTPAPIPTPEATPAGVAPGVTSEGVNSNALAGAHAAYLANRSYTIRVNRTVRYANETLRSQVETQIRLSRNRSYRTTIQVAGPHATRVIGRPPARAEFWSDGHRYMRAFTRNNETRYNEFQPVAGAGTWRFWVHFFVLEGPARDDIAAIFGATDAHVLDQRTVDGNRHVRLTAKSLTGPPSFVDIEEAEAVRNVTVRATVDERGFLQDYRLRYTATIKGKRVDVVRTVVYRDIGQTTVERPSWYDRVPG